MGDSQRLADLLKIKVVSNFRDNDVKNGGEGAPLTPIFHYYLTKKIKKKICFLNLGGISNITWIDHAKQKGINNILAYDVGPCCSLLDDWVNFKINKKYDNFGTYAKKGVPNRKILQTYLKNDFCTKGLLYCSKNSFNRLNHRIVGIIGNNRILGFKILFKIK